MPSEEARLRREAQRQVEELRAELERLPPPGVEGPAGASADGKQGVALGLAGRRARCTRAFPSATPQGETHHMARDIVIWPNKVLSTPTKPVTDFGASLTKLLDEMFEAMKEAEGIGIAANQVGVPLRLSWVGREDGTFFEIINPQILEKSGPVTLDEGCLSVPDLFEKTPRFHKVKVKYQDRTGAWQELEAEGKLAHVLQHEIGHLDGFVFVDLLSGLKRGLAMEKMKKLQKALKRRKNEDE